MKKQKNKSSKNRFLKDVIIITILLLLILTTMFIRPKQKEVVAEEVQKRVGIPYQVDHIPQSSKRPKVHRKIKYIVIHNTANPASTAKNERDYLTNPVNTSNTSWHIVVDEKEMIEAIPLTEVAHHAGTTDGNEYGIGIEICESGNYEQAEEHAVKLVAYLMKYYKIPLSRVTTHQDFSGKPCPRLLIDRWDDFLRRVEEND